MESWPSTLPQSILINNDLTYVNGLDNEEGKFDKAQNRQRTNPEKELEYCNLTGDNLFFCTN